MPYIEFDVFDNQAQAQQHALFLQGIGRTVRPIEGPYSAVQLQQCAAVQNCALQYDRDYAAGLWVVTSTGN